MERAETLRREEEVPSEQSRRGLAGLVQVQQRSSDILLSHYNFECLKAAERGTIASILKRSSTKNWILSKNKLLWRRLTYKGIERWRLFWIRQLRNSQLSKKSHQKIAFMLPIMKKQDRYEKWHPCSSMRTLRFLWTQDKITSSPNPKRSKRRTIFHI